MTLILHDIWGPAKSPQIYIFFVFFSICVWIFSKGPSPKSFWMFIFFSAQLFFFNICWIFSKGPSPKSFWMFVSLLVFLSMLNQCLMIATIQKKGTFFICKIKEKHCKYQWIIGTYGFWGGGTIYVYIYMPYILPDAMSETTIK